MAKISKYRLRCKNRKGRLMLYHFSTYFWKGITGIMVTRVKKIRKEVVFKEDLLYSECE